MKVDKRKENENGNDNQGGPLSVPPDLDLIITAHWRESARVEKCPIWLRTR